MKHRKLSLPIIQIALFIIGLHAGALTVRAQQPGTTVPAPVAPAPSANTPASTTGTGQAPSGNSPRGRPPEPGANARPVTPSGQVEQSAHPPTQADQQSRGPPPATQTEP